MEFNSNIFRSSNLIDDYFPFVISIIEFKDYLVLN